MDIPTPHYHTRTDAGPLRARLFAVYVGIPLVDYPRTFVIMVEHYPRLPHFA